MENASGVDLIGEVDNVGSVVVVSHQLEELGLSLSVPCYSDDRIGQSLIAIKVIDLDEHTAGSIVECDIWSAERPSGTGVKVDEHSILLCFGSGVIVHLHPLVAKERNIVGLVALYTIYRAYFQSADTCIGILLDELFQVGRIDRAAHPPPTAAWLGVDRRVRPFGKDAIVVAASSCRGKEAYQGNEV